MTGPDQRFSGPFFRHRTGLFRPYSVDTTYLTAATYSPADLAVFVGILVIGLVVPFMAPAYTFQIAVLYLMVVFALTWDIMGGQMGYNSLGKIPTSGGQRDVASLTSSEKLKEAGIAYILQDKSVFPSMTVEENLWMGGYLMDQRAQAKEAAERVFDKYPRLAERRRHQAKVLSGGERRLLEISRALVMNPDILLVDEPSIGLEPRFIDMVFEILDDLQHGEGKTILMVEQNAKKGLDFADIGYVLVSGELAIAGKGDDLLANPDVGRLFLGG